MCGFVGGTDPSWSYSKALDAIAHRGPDARRLELDGPVKVGFQRLSIVDLGDAAGQPMIAPDGETWIAFNGEIYGWRRLRAELEKRGHAFRTESDTEVALNAYLEWGDGFVDRIDGMFAVAIWDARERRLRLYRDRAGIKPLYYFYDGRSLAFASELKAIVAACGRAALEIDGTALYDFLSYRYVPAPKTLYRNCFKLLPAHTVEFDPEAGRLEPPRPYWSLDVPELPRTPDLDAACEELRALIEESVRDQIIADVPVGFFLSGGVDSSAVVASAARIGVPDIATFSIGFDSDEVSETPYAREVAKSFGTRHHERILMPDDAADLLPSLAAWFDEPFADESAMPTYLVSKVARERVKVVLTGDGGDEVFGGYRTYPRFARYAAYPTWSGAIGGIAHALRRRFPRRHPLAKLATLAETAFSGGPRLWGLIMGGMPERDKDKYRAALGVPKDYDDWWAFRRHWREDLPLYTRLQYVDFHTFLPDLVLTKVDRTSMAVSLEVRVPLLARSIIEFSFSLDESVRFPNGELKGLLRRAFRGILSDRILDRRKKGFGIPRYYLKGVDGGKPFQEHVLTRLFPDGIAHARSGALGPEGGPEARLASRHER